MDVQKRKRWWIKEPGANGAESICVAQRYMVVEGGTFVFFNGSVIDPDLVLAYLPQRGAQVWCEEAEE